MPEHDEIRALLATLRTDEPVPTDVAERLDHVLSHEHPLEPTPSRRPRRLGLLVAAAAACVAASVGASQLLAPHADTGAASSGAGATARPDQQSSGLESDAESGTDDVGGVITLHRATLRADATAAVRAIERRSGALAGNLGSTAAGQAPSAVPSSPGPAANARQQYSSKAAPAGCAVPVPDGAVRQDVMYDGRPATLTVVPVAGTGQAVVRVYRCATQVASVTVPLPGR